MIFIEGNIKKEKRTEKENTYGRMEIYIKGILKMVCVKVMDNYMKVIKFIKVFILIC